MLIDFKYGCPRCNYISIMNGYPVIIVQIWNNGTYIKGSTLHASAAVSGLRIKAECSLTGRA